MGEDISRSTFNPAKRYSAVRQQQGRVSLDADWNEQIDIAAHRLNTQTRDLFGYAGAPRDAAGFDILAPGAPTFAPNDAIISPGRIYVAGHLCELNASPVAIVNFTGDSTAAAGTQVQLAATVLDGLPLLPNQWVQISAQGNPAPSPALAQITAVNAAANSVTFSSNVSSFGSPNTSPMLIRLTTYLTQPDYLSPPALPTSGNGIAYLDVWERTVSAGEDPTIQEIALGGPDTTTRTKTLWQLKVLPLPTGTSASCSTPDSQIPSWQTATQPSAALLTNGVLPSSGAGPCSIATGSGYTGIENQFYRVQVHQPGNLYAAIPPANFPLPAGTATFKWSRDNASVTTGVISVAAASSSAGAATSQLTVQSTGRDANLSFCSQNWIEITDDVLELSGQPGELHQIDNNGVDRTRSTVTLTSAVSGALQARIIGSINYNTRITRWDQGGQILQAGSNTLWVDLNGPRSTGDIPVPPPGVTLILENGITVSFNTSSAAAAFNTADAWTFAARAANGSIESLVQASPSAIRHSYCRLGSISFDANPWSISDCRHLFPPLADPGIHVTGVTLNATSLPLQLDSTVTVPQLTSGISISCDGPVDPLSVHQPNNTTAPIVSTAQATCFVTVGLPLVSANVIFGFQSVALGATVSLDTSQQTIHWVPSAAVTTALTAQLNAIGSQISAAVPVIPTMLAHLTLKGNSIWSANDSNVFLDGETFTTPYYDANGNEYTGLVFPSGDGRRGGDFSMWFWLTTPAIPPALSISTNSLTFNNTSVNVASNALPVTVTNSGGAPATLTLLITGNTADFSETSTSTSLAAGASSTVNVTFKPTATGVRTATLTITSGNIALAVALNGTGIAYQLQANPTALDFGVVPNATTTPPQIVTIINTGTVAVSITNVSNASSSFKNSSNCSIIVPNQSCYVYVSFVATAGAHSDSLTFTTNPPNLLNPITLSGTGTTPKNQIADQKRTSDAKTTADNKPIKDKPKGMLEQIVRPILNVTLPQAALEPAVGQAFIQPAERPAVGEAALEEPQENPEQEPQ